MPKETIVEANNRDREGEDQHRLQVSWSKEYSQGVQVGVVFPDMPFKWVDPEGESYEHHSLWMELDRDGMNRVIRVLRKARDQAFGRDE